MCPKKRVWVHALYPSVQILEAPSHPYGQMAGQPGVAGTAVRSQASTRGQDALATELAVRHEGTAIRTNYHVTLFLGPCSMRFLPTYAFKSI